MEQAAEKHGVNPAAEPHSPLNAYHRNAFVELPPQLRIFVDVEYSRLDAVLLQHTQGVVTKMAPAPRIKNDVSHAVLERASQRSVRLTGNGVCQSGANCLL